MVELLLTFDCVYPSHVATFLFVCSEDWISAIQVVAEKLQILDESEMADMQFGDEESRSMKKRKVVSCFLKTNGISH